MGQISSFDRYDHDNFLSIPQLEALSKKEAKLTLAQRRNCYSCKSKFIPHSSLRPFDIDNVPAKFNLQRLLQHEYILEAQVAAIKGKLPFFKNDIIQSMRVEVASFVNSQEMLRILTCQHFSGESCARSFVNLIPPSDKDLAELAIKEQTAATIRAQLSASHSPSAVVSTTRTTGTTTLLKTTTNSIKNDAILSSSTSKYPNNSGLHGDDAFISSIPSHHSEYNPKHCGHAIRAALFKQIELLSDDALFCAYHITKRRIDIAVRYLVQELYEGLQIQLLYNIILEKLDLAQTRFKIQSLDDFRARHRHRSEADIAAAIIDANEFSIPYIQPPTFACVARIYYSDAPYTPLVLAENILSLIFNLYRSSSHQTLLSFGRSYLLLRLVQWKVLTAQQYYLQDQKCYAVLAPKLIASFHAKFPQDLATKYVHDCLKRTDFNIDEAEDLYHREIQRRENAVQTLKSMVLATGGSCTASDRACVQYLEKSHWDYSIAVERYQNAVLIEQDSLDEIEYQNRIKTKQNLQDTSNEGTSKHIIDNQSSNSTHTSNGRHHKTGTKSVNKDGLKQLDDIVPPQQQVYSSEPFSGILTSSPQGQKLSTTLSELIFSSNSLQPFYPSLSLPISPISFAIHGPLNTPTLSISIDIDNGLDVYSDNILNPCTIYTLSESDYDKIFFSETSRCVSSYFLAQLEAQRLDARYSVLIDFDTRNIPLTVDHPWFKNYSQIRKKNISLESKPDLKFNDFLEQHYHNTALANMTITDQSKPNHSLEISHISTSAIAASENGFGMKSDSSSSSFAIGMIKTPRSATSNGKSAPTMLSQTFASLALPLPDKISTILTKSIAYEPNTEITKLFTLTGNKPPPYGQQPSGYQQKHGTTILSPLIESDLTLLWVLPNRNRITPSQALFIQYGGKRYVQEYLSRFNAKGNPKPGDVIITNGHQSCSKYILHIVAPESFSSINEVMDLLNIAFQSIKSFPQLTGNTTLPLRVVQFTSLHNCIQNIPIFFSIHILHAFIRQYLDITANRRALDKLIVCMDDDKFYHVALRIACIYFPPPGYDSHRIVKMYEDYYLGRKREQIDHYQYIQSITPYNDHIDEQLIEWYNDKIENTKRFI